MRHMLMVGLWLSLLMQANAEETPRDFNKLIGTWKGTGTPEGTPDVRQKGLWTEQQTIIWKFTRDANWIDVQFTDSKLFTKATLRPSNDKKEWTWSATRPDQSTVNYTGIWDGKQFQLSRVLDETKTEERLVISPLHDNRFVYRLETRKVGGTLWTKQYQVGLTKEGVPFANVGASESECIVSGGRGTSTVTYMGKTYYVCCSGCRDEFKEDPKKYVDAWEAKRKK